MNSIARTTDNAKSSAGQPNPATSREERLVTSETIAAVDHWLDEADVFAKPYTAGIGPGGRLETIGLRIGERPFHLVARFGDTVVRHANGSHTVLSPADAAELEQLRTRVAELEAAAAQVAKFCAARAEYVDNINNCSPSNDRDYWRWNGHAEARRQLSQLLGLPVGWPLGDGAR